MTDIHASFLFDHPPAERSKLTNRERLVCELADIFTREVKTTMQLRWG